MGGSIKMSRKSLFVVFCCALTGFVQSLQVILPSTKTVFEMEFLNLTCNATDYGPENVNISLTFAWRKLSSSESIPPGPSLLLAPIKKEDDGEYECRVTTPNNQTATGIVRISVQYMPRWTMLTVNKFGSAEGGRVSINCSVFAFPLPSFYWLSPQRLNITSSSDYNIATSGNTSLLTIGAVKASDYGNYTCAAYNAAGVSKFTLPLMMPGKPDSPLQCKATEVGSKSANLECIPGYNGGQTQLQYSVTKESPGSSGPEKTSSSIRSSEAERTDISVNDLSPGVNYTLKIYAENDYGRSDDSFGVLVWTKAQSSSPLPLAIIIGASVGGGVFLILMLIIFIVCCVKCCSCSCCKRKRLQSQQLAKSTDKLVEKNTPVRRYPPGSQVNSGSSNPTPIRVPPTFLNLNHDPGESYVGYENSSYDGNLDNCVRSANNANLPYTDCTMAAKAQPSLAGCGALRTMIEMAPLEKPKAKRCSVPVPPFQPDVTWEYPRERLYIRQKLGKGSYSEVWQAKAEGILGRPGQRMVAVKMLREEYTSEEEQYLYKDLEVMKLLQPHPNIILLLGCCSRSRPLYLIMELATNGSLLNLLRQQRHAFSPNNLDEDQPRATRQRHVNLMMHDLMKFALQVASGLDYISSNQLIHRDLAARNVLLDEQMVCKISDFGSREDVIEVRQYESKTKRRLPLRWMAPESLTMSEYSVQTDIWSFGILMWEIITLGSTPYPGLSGPQVMEMVQKGSHMTKPPNCPDAMFLLMKGCWKFYPAKRPQFQTLKAKISHLVEESANDCIYVDQMAENAYEILHNQPGEKC